MKVLQQNCGRAESAEAYEDWKAGQNAIARNTGLLFSYWDPDTLLIVAFFQVPEGRLQRGQKWVHS